MKSGKIFIYDTTLRDGSQGEGISLSLTDKLRIADKLDEFGVSYIEGGWPGSNPKDMEFFERVKKRKFKNARIAAFGCTRRAKLKVQEDDNIIRLLESETPVVTIFGKSWMLHVTDVLRISPEENIELVGDSCEYLKSKGREVIFDAEHFFDGYKNNSDYAMKVLKTAAANGASSVVLCDTNGGTLPSQIAFICDAVRKALPPEICLGIHCHNDAELAVANSLIGVEYGVRHIQGTINGIGERCGNANLCSIIAPLELKMGYKALPPGKLEELRAISLFVDEIANQKHNKRQPYVGESAFAHKAGMHVNAVGKNPVTFEHVKPESVGNKRRILVSDLSGSTNIEKKLVEENICKPKDKELIKKILEEIKKKENLGYEYEAADASFALLAKKVMKEHDPFFELNGFRVIVEKRGHNKPCLSEATVKLTVLGKHELTAAEGDGPVNALDRALRKALIRFYPDIADVRLLDYKVRILEGDNGTAAKTRVLIESGNDTDTWSTVGVSENIIEASWEAMLDSIEYVLYKIKEKENKK